MTQQEILRYARNGILAERHFCLEMREKAMEAAKTHGEAARKLADAFQRDIDALDAKLKELENASEE